MSDTAPPFSMFGPAHLGALFTIAIAGIALIQKRRGISDSQGVRRWELGLAVSLVLAFFYRPVSQVWLGTFDVNFGLPLHFCDMASITAIGALLTHRQTWCELTYFFGLSGTAQALITPALAHTFPHTSYWFFFIGHGAVVITALYVVLALRHSPGKNGVRHTMMMSTAYAVIVGGLNAWLGTNYGFLCAKPPSASLMDALGPWPWYLVALWLMAWGIFKLLDLPFRSARK